MIDQRVTEGGRSELNRGSETREPHSWKKIRRWPLVMSVAVVVAILVITGTLWGLHGHQASSVPLPARTAPITLPERLGGLAAGPLAADFAVQPIWRQRAQAAAPGAIVVGRAYGSAQVRRQIRVVAGRADLAGKLEFAWAADSGRTLHSSLGTAHCTQNLILVARSNASVRPTAMLCWRTTSALSVYSFVIDFDHHPTTAGGVAVLDATWRVALTGR